MSMSLSISHVGIADFHAPVRIPEKNGGVQQTVATVKLGVRAPRVPAGASTGLMIRRLAQCLPDLHSDVFPGLLSTLREELAAECARISMRFPYFIGKTAPVSGTASLMEYQCAFSSTSGQRGEPELTVIVPVTTLCPCSREISAFGAHNQRATVTLTARPRRLVWLEDLIALAEAGGSSEVYALLKRPDEKFVTEWAYEHPMFVEDVARKVAQQVAAHPDIDRFSVSVESFESIHGHNAFALVDSESMADSGN